MSIGTKAMALAVGGCLLITATTFITEIDIRGVYYTRKCNCGGIKESYLDLNKGQQSIEENCWECMTFDRVELTKQD